MALQEIVGEEVLTYYIVYNTGVTLTGTGFVDVGQRMTCDRDTLETFTDEQEYIDRCVELGIEPDLPD